MWQILLITACLAQVSVVGARSECDALHVEVAALRKLLVETNERRDAKEAEIKERIDTNEVKLQERIANEAKLHARIASLEEQRQEDEAKLQERIARLEEQQLKNGAIGAELNPAAASPYIYSAYGCFQDTISLSCPDARTIFVTNAIYGQFLQSCSHEGIACCPPNPIDDCVEDLETDSPQDWLLLKTWCDDQNNCTFQNEGGYVASCADPNVVDYMTVNYQCLPENGTVDVIAFTASADAYRDYGVDETILFNEVLTNFGGGYDPVSSMFTCPVSGVYVISITVMSPPGINLIEGQVMKETEIYTSTHADDHADAYTSSSTTSVLHCEAGERVWIRSDNENSVMFGDGAQHRLSTVSGFLLYAD